jgi:hypothetical protein
MPVAHLARQLVAHNGLDVHVHHADICEMQPVEPVDWIVSDFLGCFLVDDHMLPAVEAAGRWLKPQGRFCPGEVRLHIAPAGNFSLQHVDLWSEPFYGVDLTPAEAEGLRVVQPGNLREDVLLAPAQEFHRFVPPGPATAFDGTHRFTFARAGKLTALAGWFAAPLADGVVLTNAPGAETHWGQQLFPLPRIDVAAGDTLEIRLHLDTEWRWSGSVAGHAFEIAGVS